MTGIYKIESPTSRVYIGQSHNIPKRIKGYIRKDCKKQPLLYNSINKYGSHNHKFSVECELPNDISQEVLDSFEQFFIDQYRGAGVSLLNIKEGGYSGKHLPETKAKISQSLKGKPLSEKAAQSRIGRKHSDQTRAKMSQTRKGRPISEQRKQAMRIEMKGNKRAAKNKNPDA